MIGDIEAQNRAKSFTSFVCREYFLSSFYCELVVNTICGFNRKGLELERKILENIYRNVAHSISAKQFDHFFQNVKSGEFRWFDFGDNNSRIYDSTTPPSYELKRITVPTYLYSASCDAVIAEVDVDRLQEVLPNVRSRKTFKNYNHCDFNYGKNSRQRLYENMMKAMTADAKN